MLEDARTGGLAGASVALESGVILSQTYFTPLGPESEAALGAVWAQLTGQEASPLPELNSLQTSAGRAPAPDCGGALDVAAAAEAGLAAAAPQPTALRVMFGRTLTVRRAAGGVAWCTFEELCARALGAADYLALGHSYHTLLLSGVPSMSMQVRRMLMKLVEIDRMRRIICARRSVLHPAVRFVTSLYPEDRGIASQMQLHATVRL